MWRSFSIYSLHADRMVTICKKCISLYIEDVAVGVSVSEWLSGFTMI